MPGYRGREGTRVGGCVTPARGSVLNSGFLCGGGEVSEAVLSVAADIFVEARGV